MTAEKKLPTYLVTTMQPKSLEQAKVLDLAVQSAIAAGVPTKTVTLVVENVRAEAMELPFWGSSDQIVAEVSRRLNVLQIAALNWRSN